jgi:hypothetical protein
MSSQRDQIGPEITSREVLYDAVLKLPVDTTSKTRRRLALLREFDDGNGRTLVEADFREGTPKYNIILRELGKTYDAVLQSYLDSSRKRGAFLNVRETNTNTVISNPSPLFMVTIEVLASKQRVVPPLELLIAGCKYKLKAVVQRPYASSPGGGHYTCCELSRNGGSICDYNDSSANLYSGSREAIANHLREARCLVYEIV